MNIYLLEELRKMYPGNVVITASGSVFGKPWLKANGFKKKRPFGWILQ